MKCIQCNNVTDSTTGLCSLCLNNGTRNTDVSVREYISREYIKQGKIYGDPTNEGAIAIRMAEAIIRYLESLPTN